MKERNWYTLDNIGKFYAFTSKDKVPAVFRYSVTLTTNIDAKILQKALEYALECYPNFNCHLKKGFFWYYLENTDSPIHIYKENFDICAKLYKDEDDNLIRVSYYGRRINFEISHILSDGRGSLSFFKCLIYKYLCLKEKLDDIALDINSSPYEQMEDSYDKYYTKEKIRVKKNHDIYQFKGKKRKNILYMEYHISTSKALEIAHKYNASLTSLLLSVLILAYRERMKKIEYHKTIKIEVPIDLRNFFKSQTFRNFFGITSVSYTFKNDETNFENIIKSVNKELKKNTTPEQLKIRMNQMISIEKNIVARFVPIFIKDLGLKIADYLTSSSCTSRLSNIGAIKIDERLEKYIENFNVLTTCNTLRLTVCSFKDDLSIGISTKYQDNSIIKDFCAFFSNHGITGTINTTEEDNDEKM